MLLTMDCWDCQIKPHLAMLSVWHPLEEDTSVRALTIDIDLLYSQPSPPPPSPPPWGESKLITHLVIDVTVHGAFP